MFAHRMRNPPTHALFLAAPFCAMAISSPAQVPTAVDKVNITPPNYKVPHFLEGSQDTSLPPTSPSLT